MNEDTQLTEAEKAELERIKQQGPDDLRDELTLATVLLRRWIKAHEDDLDGLNVPLKLIDKIRFLTLGNSEIKGQVGRTMGVRDSEKLKKAFAEIDRWAEGEFAELEKRRRKIFAEIDRWAENIFAELEKGQKVGHPLPGEDI